MSEEGSGRGPWPRWLAPLRPDEVSRSRMRAVILARASGPLRARRGTGWREVAERWTTTLAPLAAGLALVFAGLAYRATRPVGAGPDVLDVATVEELVGPAPAGAPPELLTAGTEPTADRVLQAAMAVDDGER